MRVCVCVARVYYGTVGDEDDDVDDDVVVVVVDDMRASERACVRVQVGDEKQGGSESSARTGVRGICAGRGREARVQDSPQAGAAAQRRKLLLPPVTVRGDERRRASVMCHLQNAPSGCFGA